MITINSFSAFALLFSICFPSILSAANSPKACNISDNEISGIYNNLHAQSEDFIEDVKNHVPVFLLDLALGTISPKSDDKASGGSSLMIEDYCIDQYEQNDEISNPNTSAFSSNLGSSAYNNDINATIHESGDWDHYRINITTKGTLTLNLTNVPDGFDLQLYDYNHNYIDGSITTGNEQIIQTINSTGYYYIIVGSLQGDYSCNQYNLEVDWSPNSASCEDAWEPNDEITNPDIYAFSRLLGSEPIVNHITGSIHESGDWDHYRLRIYLSGTLEINLTNVPDGYDLQLYDYDHNYVAGSLTAGDEQIIHDINKGEYYIIVGSLEGDHSCSPYTLEIDWSPEVPQCEDIYEPNEEITNSNTSAFSSSLGNSAYSKSIYATIDVLNDWDYYRLNITSKGELSLGISQVRENFVLSLYNSQYQLIGRSMLGDYFFRETIENPGVYYMSVGSQADDEYSCNQYKLSIDWDPETSGCEDSYEPNNEITNPNTSAFSNNLGSSAHNSNINATIHESGDWDHYRINIVNTGTLELNLTNVPDGFDLQLYDYNHNYIDGSITSGDEYISYSVSNTGYYYVIVGSLEGDYSCIQYNLEVDWSPVVPQCEDIYEPNEEITNANTSAFSNNLGNSAFTRTISGTIDILNDWDFYQLNITNKGELRVSYGQNIRENYELSLYNSNHQTIESTIPGVYSVSEQIISTGHYYISVGSLANDEYSCNEYELTVRWNPDDPGCEDSFEPNDEIENPDISAFTNNLGTSDYSNGINGTIHEPGDWDHYEVNVTNPGDLTILLTNVPDGFDLQLYDYDHNYITGSFENGDEQVIRTLNRAGKYYIVVGSLSDDFSCSEYHLRINWSADNSGCEDIYEPNDEITNPATSAFSSNLGGAAFRDDINGTLHESGDWDHYRVNITNNGTLTLSLTNVPDDFDLQLYDYNHSYISGSMTSGDEHIVQTINNEGEYYLIVGSLQGGHSCAEYNLEVDWSPIISGCEDSFEPNNNLVNSNTSAFSSTLNSVSYSNSLSGTIHESGDLDYYRLNIQNKGILYLSLTNIPWGIDLQLYDASNNFISGSFTTGNEEISESVSSSGYYHVVVGSMTGDNSCSPYNLEVDWIPTEISLDVTPQTKSVGSSSGTTTFQIESDVTWNASETASWLSVEKTSSTLLTVYYDENNSGEARSAAINISGPGVDARSVTLYQNGKSCSLNVLPEVKPVSSQSGMTAFIITSNCDWAASGSSDWFTVTKLNPTTMSVVYNDNTDSGNRTGNITVSIPGISSHLVRIEQAGRAPVLNVTPLYRNLGPASGTTTFIVSSNINWTVSENSEWLSAVKVNPTTLNITYDENKGFTERSASIILNGSGVDSKTISIKQEGINSKLSLTPLSKLVGSSSGTTTFTVNSNLDWVVSEKTEWIAVTKMSATSMSVTFNENSNANERTGTITIYASGTTPITVTLRQSGTGTKLIADPIAQTVHSSAGSTTFKVDANINWLFYEMCNWLYASKTNDSTLTIDYEKNTGSISRTGEITLSGFGLIPQKITVIQIGAGTKIKYNRYQDNNITIYPIPASDKIYVKAEADFNEDVSISVYNKTGQLVIHEQRLYLMKKVPFEIDISELSGGIYFIQFNTTRSVGIEKIVIE